MTNIITGLQVTGGLHIGNYFGSIKPMALKSSTVEDQNNMFLMVADLHSLTAEIDYNNFYEEIITSIKIYLASGYAASKSNINLFRQSHVLAHSQLNWYLSCFAYFGELSRMTQFKDKSNQNETNINLGLFAYPVLMTADILLYDAEYVPVGEDQRQHIELARNLSIRINNKFKQEIFTVPLTVEKQLEYFKQVRQLRIRSLVDPMKKMSKSSSDLKSKILLFDTPEIATKKIMSATTDLLESINYNWETQPGISNLMDIMSLTSGRDLDEIIKTYSGQTRYGDFKKDVAKAVCEFLIDFQAKFNQIDDEMVKSALEKGEENANNLANRTLLRFEKALGLRK
jgi:tryptophanyl-tRNA synthetase